MVKVKVPLVAGVATTPVLFTMDGPSHPFNLEVYPGLVLYGPPFWPDLVVSGKRVSEHRDAKVKTSTV